MLSDVPPDDEDAVSSLPVDPDVEAVLSDVPPDDEDAVSSLPVVPDVEAVLSDVPPDDEDAVSPPPVDPDVEAVLPEDSVEEPPPWFWEDVIVLPPLEGLDPTVPVDIGTTDELDISFWMIN